MLLAIATLYGNIHLYRKRKHLESTGLSSYIEACCVWMLFLFTVTEVFSVWHGVRFLTLFGIWGLLDGVLLVLLVVQWKQYDRQGRGDWFTVCGKRSVMCGGFSGKRPIMAFYWL